MLVILLLASLSLRWFRPQFQVTFVATGIGQILMVAVVWALLKINGGGWGALGIKRFAGRDVGLGLVILAFIIIAIHNTILFLIGIETQGIEIYRLVQELASPWGLAFLFVFTAPFVEELFFRGFLFTSFRQHFSWQTAAVVSSSIFAVFHLQPVALIPTFILGFVFSYLFLKTNSIWPGVLLHTLINAFALCVLLLAIALSIEPAFP